MVGRLHESRGAELGLPGCLDLAQVLERMILRVPQTVKRAWKAARPKKIVAEGLRRGTRRHRSVALGVAVPVPGVVLEIVIGAIIGPQFLG